MWEWGDYSFEPGFLFVFQFIFGDLELIIELLFEHFVELIFHLDEMIFEARFEICNLGVCVTMVDHLFDGDWKDQECDDDQGEPAHF